MPKVTISNEKGVQSETGKGLVVDSSTVTNLKGPVHFAGDVNMTEGTIVVPNGTTVTQATNKSTSVTSNTEAGKITMNSAALGADTAVTFTVDCDKARATDVCIVNHHSTGTGKYVVDATGHASEEFKITVRNITASPHSEAIVLHYALIKTAHT